MKIMVSACLLGENCKYNGGNNLCEAVCRFVAGHEIFAVCPEVMGGLPVPREPAEIVDGVVRVQTGRSVDREYRLGAEKALEIAKREGVELVILQPRSPSCGCRQIYDGTYSHVRKEGKGVFAQLLSDNGIRCVDAEELTAAGGCVRETENGD